MKNRLELYFKLLDVTKALKLECMDNGAVTVKLQQIENNFNSIINSMPIKKDKQSQN